jgi:hypothetical protein
MLTLSENTMRVTMRQSDSEPIASEAATASCNRDEATGAERLSKPVAPDDRLMAEFLWCAGESPATDRRLGSHRRQYCGGDRFENGKMAA